MALLTRAEDDAPERPEFPQPPSTSRHPGDAIRIGLGLVLLFISLLGIERDRLTTFEVNLFRLVNQLPDALRWVLWPVMQMGNVFAAPATALVALLVLRRRRVAFDIVFCGVVAWIGAKTVKSIVERPRPGGLVEDVNRFASTEGLGFVSGHTAVATAIVAAASPYLPRRWRRIVWALPVTVGISRIYYGAHLPLDIVGGFALGWVIAATLHLLLGAPRRVPTPADAEAALTSAGIGVGDVERLDANARGSFPFAARIDGVERFVKLLDPEPRDRDWVYRAARFLAFRDVRDEVAITTTSAQAHREAAMTLLARASGARVPTIDAIESDHDRVWIIEERVEGTTIDRLSPDEVRDETLDSLWEQIGVLRQARIAHRDLVGTNVLVDGDGRVWVADFAHAKSSTRGRSLDNDVAELLVSTALVVGAERAVTAAARNLDDEALRAALPELQRFVLTGENQRNLRAAPGLLNDLRTKVAAAVGATVADVDRDDDRPARTLAVAVLVLATLVALVGIAGPSDVADVLSTPGYRWLGLAVLCVGLVQVSTAATLLASIDRRLGLGRTAGEVMLFQRRSTLDGRAVGRRALLRRLGRAGVPRSEAETAVGRWTRIRLLVALGGVVGFAAIAIVNDISFTADDDVGVVAIVVAGALAVELLVGFWDGDGWSPEPAEPGRRVRVDPVIAAISSTGEIGLGIVATMAVVSAMGGGPALAAVGLVAATTGIAARIAPVAGGPATAPAILVLGLVAAGAPTAIAVSAAVLAHLLQLGLPLLGGVVRATILAPW